MAKIILTITILAFLRDSFAHVLGPSGSTNPETVFHLLQDGPSLAHRLQYWSPRSKEDITTSTKQQDNNIRELLTTDSLCKNAHDEAKLITDAVISAVKFYEAHAFSIVGMDAVVGLQVLEGVLQHIFKQRGQNLHISLMHRVLPLIDQIMNQTLDSIQEPVQKEFAFVFSNQRSMFSRCVSQWRSADVLQTKGRSASLPYFRNMETIWPSLNRACQATLIQSCDVPYTCRRTLLNPEPQSQYMLTQQALYLIFAVQKSCELYNPELFQDWETNLSNYCEEMLEEAEFISKHNFPSWSRDLFAEYAFVCGLAAYPNFLQPDWIHAILSWQSKGKYGCFLNQGLDDYVTNEVQIPIANGTTGKDEMCLLHFTSTSLSAIALRLEYLHDLCLPVGEEYNIMLQEGGGDFKYRGTMRK